MSAPILLCAATGVEARACESGVRRGGADSRFEVLRGGMGLGRAREALKRRLDNRLLPRPSLIVSTGFAGSWSPGVGLGSWAIGRSVRSESGERRELESAWAVAPFLDRLGARCVWAEFVSLSKPKSGAREVVASGEPVLVDMESYAWAEIARSCGIPFMILRLVSDTPEEPLHGAVESFGSVAVAGGIAGRATLLAKGLTQAISQPVGLAKFLRRSAGLPRKLADGWAELASRSVSGLHRPGDQSNL